MSHPFLTRPVLCLLLTLAAGTSTAEKLTIERMFASPNLSGASLRAPKISPDGTLVTYLLGKSGARGQLDLWAFDVAGGEHRLLVDSQALAPAEQEMSAEEEARRERQRTSSLRGIVEYHFSEDSQRLLVPLGGDLYVYDLRAAPDDAVRRITDTPSYETDARFSPGGRYVSFVRDKNLVVHDLTTGEETAITTGGGGLVSFAMAEFIAQEEMSRRTGYWWSEDDSRIAYTRVDESPVAEVERFEIMADHVRVITQRYPAAGTANARVQLFAVALADPDAAIEVDLGAETDIYLARVNWFPDNETLAVQRQSRDQKTLSLLAADAATGSTRELLREQATAWVDLHDELAFLEESPRFIWASSRSGFRHLYLYENDGRLVRQLTAGDWSVIGSGFTPALKGVDEQRGVVYFMANAETPLERHLYSASLAGSEPRRLTAPGGWHSVTLSEDQSVWLDSFSTPERPPSVTLRSINGESLAVMVDNAIDADHPYAPYLDEHLPVEFGTLKASDGQTLYYQLVKPRELTPGRRYPVIVDVYGGPHSQKVRRAWGSSTRSNDGFFRQFLAQQGYVVFTLDNRGTGYRGVEFETALHLNMGSVEVEDQVAGVEFLESLPYVDPHRVGIFGWSYGGYMALMGALQAPDVFAAALAGAPVTDWRLYDTHYTERYMGKPQDNPDGYAASNVLNHAEGLGGELLVMHGMADDNVLFANSTTLFKRLQDLGKPFQTMVYPGSKHGLLRFPNTGPHGYRMVKSFFDRALAEDPEWERSRQDRKIDDLRIEAAAGVLDYSKTTYTSNDGLTIPAHLFKPLEPAPGAAPAIIYAHGGQHGRFRSRSMKNVEAMVRRGYVVLAPDYRSSAGYSREFYEAADYGGLEIDDMLAAREFLAAMPDVDPERIAILGLSHGGYNALMSLARAPGKFAAAVDFFGPTDLVWRVTSTPDENPNAAPGDREKFARMVGKTVDEAPELYRARSPRYLADRIQDPLLILHGDQDTVVLPQESQWLADALEQAGNEDFAFHVIEGGKHGYPAPAMDEAWGLAFEFLARVFEP